MAPNLHLILEVQHVAEEWSALPRFEQTVINEQINKYTGWSRKKLHKV